MSMPFAVYSCSACEFHANSTVLWGQFVYVLDDGREVPLRRVPGWCQACADIVPMEYAGVDDDTVDLAGHRDDIQRRLAEHLKAAQDSEPWWRRLLGIKPPLPVAAHDLLLRLEAVNRQMQEQAGLAQIWAGRGSPRCLCCGSTQVAQLPSTQLDPDRPEVVQIGFAHPQCGGEILAQPSDIRISMQLMRREYSPAGELLCERPREHRGR